MMAKQITCALILLLRLFAVEGKRHSTSLLAAEEVAREKAYAEDLLKRTTVTEQARGLRAYFVLLNILSVVVGII